MTMSIQSDLIFSPAIFKLINWLKNVVHWLHLPLSMCQYYGNVLINIKGSHSSRMLEVVMCAVMLQLCQHLVRKVTALLHRGHKATKLTALRQILPLHERCSHVWVHAWNFSLASMKSMFSHQGLCVPCSNHLKLCVWVCVCLYLQALGCQSTWVGHISLDAPVHSSQQWLGVPDILQVSGCPQV